VKTFDEFKKENEGNKDIEIVCLELDNPEIISLLQKEDIKAIIAWFCINAEVHSKDKKRLSEYEIASKDGKVYLIGCVRPSPYLGHESFEFK
jgi:hypothetical protein